MMFSPFVWIVAPYWMFWQLLILLLAFSVTASAQTIGGCSTGNSAWAPSTEKNCHEAGGIFYPQFATVETQKIIIGIGSDTSISSSAPKCPEGYSLILRSPGDPACARDIIDPQ